MNNLKDKILLLPQSPGVYKFLDKSDQILYVGKAISLHSRVGQYFQKNLKDGKTKQLVEHTDDIHVIEVFSELEALILEAELIRKYQPRYNINLKDDKTYLYIIVRKEGNFKKIITARKNDCKKSDVSFGPFPDAGSAKAIIKVIRRIFPFRDCSEGKYIRYKKLGSPCLYGHIGLCSAPCVEYISEKDYEADIKRIVSFLRGGQKKVVVSLVKKMKQLSRETSYEEASKIRNILKRFEYVQQSFRVPKEFMENPYLVEDIYAMALQELMTSVPILNKIPVRIECFDVANISGKDAAVSMVCALNGRIDKREYKKFRIKLKDTPDDVFMMREALTRRFLHEVRETLVSWGVPDLVVVDGGKGQVGAACKVLEDMGLSIPVIGLAKKNDTIVYKQGNLFEEISLSKSSESLKLIQRLRDESHRFARSYHHQLRSRQKT